MDLTITLSTLGDERLVEASGVLDFASVPYLRRLAFDLFDQRVRRLILDVTGVRILDAAAIGGLLYLQRHGRQRGADLVLTGASGAVLTVLDIAGAAKQLGVHERIDWADADRDRVPVPLESLESRHGAWPPSITNMLFDLHAIPAGEPRRVRLREHIIRQALPAAQRLAKRFSGTGEPSADLAQVAALGLVKAIDGFNVEYGTDFGVYATPTIIGELKRYLRDRTWGVHVPRHMQELRSLVSQGRDELTNKLGRSPTVPDLAGHLEVSEEEIILVLSAATAYRPISLETPLGGTDDATWSDTIGNDEPEYAKVENRETLRVLMRQLPRREQEILGMRFYGNLTQAEIAEKVGVSQMHVSRLLRRSLDTLRRGLTT